MKSIKVKETKTVTRFRDSSWVMDKDFNYVDKTWGDSQVSTIEEGLKIPNTRPFRMNDYYGGEAHYLDTKVEIDNNIYYVFSGHLKEIEIETEQKELFIPAFNFEESVCSYLSRRVNCLNIRCSECILSKDNFKYTQS
ncbi:MAG: hypothetical protein GY836_09100 [Herbaspirillum sp.]|uniref:hypothetical protein n=1 Tax=Herbaspirillum sp. TaxID=1890675 RepID=UPI00258BFD61|nr:hypothetical protein [Herbaspirillum sp.]MCP4555570.1 hypothetical protein [Herbaspirillum sp.]